MGLGILCPGQGHQHPEMFQRFGSAPAAQAMLTDIAAALGAPQPSPGGLALEDVPIFRNKEAQILVVGNSLLYWHVLKDRIPEPDLVLGYSVGELAAASIAGCFDARTALNLAGLRAGFMDACVTEPQGMIAAPRITRRAAAQIVSDFHLYPAIRNGPDHIVFGGLLAHCLDALKALEAQGFEPRLLNVAVASHTPLLTHAIEPFRRALEDARAASPKMALLAGCDGARLKSAAGAVEALSQQLAQTVEWRRCLDIAVESGVSCFLELGPGRALTRMIEDAYPAVSARAAEDFQTLDGLARWACLAAA
jgi:[acyl-carrier-protein] S-malonyltransferase